jgi:hypothetical protein
VVDSVTGQPVSGARVTIEAAGKPAYNTTTDAQGRFRIEGVREGVYSANFSSQSYVPPGRDAAARRPFQVSKGSNAVILKAEMLPMGRVSGRVFDAARQPVSGAGVLLDGPQGGRTKTSDAMGGFSFEATPGSYVLSARAPSGLKPPQREERLGWVRTYFPGVADIRAAARISVAAGTELWGHDIRLEASPLRRVRGMALGPDGKPAAGAELIAARTDEILPDEMETTAGPDGAFEFDALHDGEWGVSARSGDLRCSALVSITGRDVDRVDLTLSPPFELPGAVAFDGEWPLKQNVKAGILLKTPVALSSQKPIQGSAGPDSRFVINGVYPGTYKVLATPPGGQYFLGAIALGDTDITAQYVHIGSGATPLRIRFDSKGGGVRGTVEDCGGATVVLAPRERGFQEPQFVLTGKCAQGGRYEFSNIRPGDYYAFAFDRWNGPSDLLEALDQYTANRAAPVAVRAGETATADLRVTTR